MIYNLTKPSVDVKHFSNKFITNEYLLDGVFIDLEYGFELNIGQLYSKWFNYSETGDYIIKNGSISGESKIQDSTNDFQDFYFSKNQINSSGEKSTTTYYIVGEFLDNLEDRVKHVEDNISYIVDEVDLDFQAHIDDLDIHWSKSIFDNHANDLDIHWSKSIFDDAIDAIYINLDGKLDTSVFNTFYDDEYSVFVDETNTRLDDIDSEIVNIIIRLDNIDIELDSKLDADIFETFYNDEYTVFYNDVYTQLGDINTELDGKLDTDIFNTFYTDEYSNFVSSTNTQFDNIELELDNKLDNNVYRKNKKDFTSGNVYKLCGFTISQSDLQIIQITGESHPIEFYLELSWDGNTNSNLPRLNFSMDLNDPTITKGLIGGTAQNIFIRQRYTNLSNVVVDTYTTQPISLSSNSMYIGTDYTYDIYILNDENDYTHDSWVKVLYTSEPDLLNFDDDDVAVFDNSDIISQCSVSGENEGFIAKDGLITEIKDFTVGIDGLTSDITLVDAELESITGDPISTQQEANEEFVTNIKSLHDTVEGLAGAQGSLIGDPLPQVMPYVNDVVTFTEVTPSDNPPIFEFNDTLNEINIKKSGIYHWITYIQATNSSTEQLYLVLKTRDKNVPATEYYSRVISIPSSGFSGTITIQFTIPDDDTTIETTMIAIDELEVVTTDITITNWESDFVLDNTNEGTLPYLPLTGGIMNGPIDMDSNEINNIPLATVPGQPLEFSQYDDLQSDVYGMRQNIMEYTLVETNDMTIPGNVYVQVNSPTDVNFYIRKDNVKGEYHRLLDNLDEGSTLVLFNKLEDEYISLVITSKQVFTDYYYFVMTDLIGEVTPELIGEVMIQCETLYYTNNLTVDSPELESLNGYTTQKEINIENKSALESILVNKQNILSYNNFSNTPFNDGEIYIQDYSNVAHPDATHVIQINKNNNYSENHLQLENLNVGTNLSLYNKSNTFFGSVEVVDLVEVVEYYTLYVDGSFTKGDFTTYEGEILLEYISAVINPITETGELVVTTKETESLNSTSELQSEINIENKNAILALQNNVDRQNILNYVIADYEGNDPDPGTISYYEFSGSPVRYNFKIHNENLQGQTTKLLDNVGVGTIISFYDKTNDDYFSGEVYTSSPGNQFLYINVTDFEGYIGDMLGSEILIDFSTSDGNSSDIEVEDISAVSVMKVIKPDLVMNVGTDLNNDYYSKLDLFIGQGSNDDDSSLFRKKVIGDKLSWDDDLEYIKNDSTEAVNIKLDFSMSAHLLNSDDESDNEVEIALRTSNASGFDYTILSSYTTSKNDSNDDEQEDDKTYSGNCIYTIEPGATIAFYAIMPYNEIPRENTGRLLVTGFSLVAHEIGKTVSDSGGSGSETLLELLDTPDTYVGHSNDAVFVSYDETEIVFKKLQTPHVSLAAPSLESLEGDKDSQQEVNIEYKTAIEELQANSGSGQFPFEYQQAEYDGIETVTNTGEFFSYGSSVLVFNKTMWADEDKTNTVYMEPLLELIKVGDTIVSTTENGDKVLYEVTATDGSDGNQWVFDVNFTGLPSTVEGESCYFQVVSSASEQSVSELSGCSFNVPRDTARASSTIGNTWTKLDLLSTNDVATVKTFGTGLSYNSTLDSIKNDSTESIDVTVDFNVDVIVTEIDDDFNMREWSMVVGLVSSNGTVVVESDGALNDFGVDGDYSDLVAFQRYKNYSGSVLYTMSAGEELNLQSYLGSYYGTTMTTGVRTASINVVQVGNITSNDSGNSGNRNYGEWILTDSTLPDSGEMNYFFGNGVVTINVHKDNVYGETVELLDKVVLDSTISVWSSNNDNTYFSFGNNFTASDEGDYWKFEGYIKSNFGSLIIGETMSLDFKTPALAVGTTENVETTESTESISGTAATQNIVNKELVAAIKSIEEGENGGNYCSFNSNENNVLNYNIVNDTWTLLKMFNTYSNSIINESGIVFDETTKLFTNTTSNDLLVKVQFDLDGLLPEDSEPDHVAEFAILDSNMDIVCRSYYRENITTLDPDSTTKHSAASGIYTMPAGESLGLYVKISNYTDYVDTYNCRANSVVITEVPSAGGSTDEELMKYNFNDTYTGDPEIGELKYSFSQGYLNFKVHKQNINGATMSMLENLVSGAIFYMSTSSNMINNYQIRVDAITNNTDFYIFSGFNTSNSGSFINGNVVTINYKNIIVEPEPVTINQTIQYKNLNLSIGSTLIQPTASRIIPDVHLYKASSLNAIPTVTFASFNSGGISPITIPNDNTSISSISVFTSGVRVLANNLTNTDAPFLEIALWQIHPTLPAQGDHIHVTTFVIPMEDGYLDQIGKNDENEDNNGYVRFSVKNLNVVLSKDSMYGLTITGGDPNNDPSNQVALTNSILVDVTYTEQVI